MNNLRLWEFVADMNFDGAVTISDIWLWIKWWYTLPGDIVVVILAQTPIARFFEISFSDVGGGISAIVSVLYLIWVLPMGWEKMIDLIPRKYSSANNEDFTNFEINVTIWFPIVWFFLPLIIIRIFDFKALVYMYG